MVGEFFPKDDSRMLLAKDFPTLNVDNMDKIIIGVSSEESRKLLLETILIENYSYVVNIS